MQSANVYKRAAPAPALVCLCVHVCVCQARGTLTPTPSPCLSVAAANVSPTARVAQGELMKRRVFSQQHRRTQFQPGAADLTAFLFANGEQSCCGCCR